MNELQPSSPEMGMKDFLAILRRRIWVILPILLLCLGGAYAWTKRTPPTYRAESQVVLIQRGPSSSSLEDMAPQTMESMETQVGLIESPEMARQTLNWMKNLNNQQVVLKEGVPDGPVPLTQDDILEGVKVTNPLDSNLLDITADANDRKQASDIANAVALAFRAWKQKIASDDMKMAAANLQAKVEKAKIQMDAANRLETAFKETHQVADIESAEKDAVGQAVNADNTVVALNQKFASQAARVKALDADLKAANAAVGSPNGIPDEGQVQALQAQIQQLVADRQDAGTKYNYSFQGAPGMPSLASLDQQIKQKRQQLVLDLKATTNDHAPSLGARSSLAQQYLDAREQLASTQEELASAEAARNTYQQQVQQMPSLQNKYGQLALNKELATGLYKSLKADLNATQLQLGKVSGNIQVTESAAPPLLPFKPNLKTNLLLGFALGALLSLGLVMLMEQMDQRVRTLDEVRALVSGPIIGMLPKTSAGRMYALGQGRLLPEFEEAFSLIRVNLSYVLRHSMTPEKTQHQTILVTSAVPGEGKSVTAAQLARSMAEAGQSVILVDANLRRPVQNILFQSGDTGGLTDVLSGQLPLDEAIATSNVEGLSILNSGVSSQNPTVLLSQPRLAAVMEALRFKADVVIIDAPDCSSVADTLLLTQHADYLLQVVRPGFGDMETLHNASQALHNTGKKVTVVANGLSRPQQRVYRSRFAYAALAGHSTEPPALPQTFEKTMVMNRSRDLVFSKSTPKVFREPPDETEKNEAS